MADLWVALIGCLERLGGVPEKLVHDNNAAIVAAREGGRARLHPEAAAMLGQLRTTAVPLAPRQPTSKGQVERTIGYLETSFLPLRSFASLADLQAQHDAWATEVAFDRTLRRTGARVADRFAVERGFLHRLPDPLPDTDLHLEARAGKVAFVRVLSADYSVPPACVGRRIAIRVRLKRVHLSREGVANAEHRRSFVCADVVLDPPMGAPSASPVRPGDGSPRVRLRPRSSTSPAMTGSARCRHERGHRVGAGLSVAGPQGPRIREVAPRPAETAHAEGWDHETYLAAVLSEEVSAREGHGGEARVKAARFPAVKTIDDFDFTVQTSVKRATVAHLAQLDFLAEAQNIVFLGPPGTGKTHCETDDPALSRATAQTGAGSGGHDPNDSLAVREPRRAGPERVIGRPGSPGVLFAQGMSARSLSAPVRDAEALA